MFMNKSPSVGYEELGNERSYIALLRVNCAINQHWPSYLLKNSLGLLKSILGFGGQTVNVGCINRQVKSHANLVTLANDINISREIRGFQHKSLNCKYRTGAGEPR